MSVCLVLGGGGTLRNDVAAYDGAIDGVVACNEAGIEWPGRLDAWVTLHSQFWESKGWRQARADRGYCEALIYYGHNMIRPPVPDYTTQTQYTFPGQKHSGSSGLFAAKVAMIDLGFDQVVFCGVPMTRTPHFWDEKKIDWKPAESFRQQWLALDEQYRNRMRSMSGWTKALLGLPEWSNQDA